MSSLQNAAISMESAQNDRDFRDRIRPKRCNRQFRTLLTEQSSKTAGIP